MGAYFREAGSYYPDKIQRGHQKIAPIMEQTDEYIAVLFAAVHHPKRM
jgi:hypothetical protein